MDPEIQRDTKKLRGEGYDGGRSGLCDLGDRLLFAIYRGGILGVSFFDSQTNEVGYLECEEDTSFPTLKMAIYENAPTQVSTSMACKSDIEFLQVLASSPEDLMNEADVNVRSSLQGDEESMDSNSFPIPTSGNLSPSKNDREEDQLADVVEAELLRKIHFLKTAECSLDEAREKLGILRIASMPSTVDSHKEKIAFLSSCIDPDHTLGWRAVGGMLALLFKQKIGGQLSNDEDPFYLDGLEQLHLKNYARVSPQALHSLQIFQNDAHPLLAGSGRSKEGLSLFGIVNRTRTPQGQRLLRHWFSRPLFNKRAIEERQEAVKILLRQDLSDFLSRMKEALRQIKNISGIMKRITNVMSSVTDWSNLLHSSQGFLRLSETVSSNSLLSSLPIFRAFKDRLDEARIRELCELLQATIDFERSKENKSLSILQGVCSDVDELREVLEGLDDFLTDVGVQELQRLAQAGLRLQKLQVIFFPQVGYLLSVAKEHVLDIEPSLLSEVGLKFLFGSNEANFYKNEQMITLDREIGDINGAIRDREGVVIREMEQKAVEYFADLLTASKFAALVDCILAYAEAAVEFDWICPELSTSRGIEIKDGRHPLQELCVSSFISNSSSLAPGTVNLISGPNYSGKSIYAKQVAIITYMAQVGLFIPATAACIGLVDQFLCRIRSFESVSLQQSSFFIDCSQVAYALRNASQDSMMVIDEFGKGTAESDGISLLGAVINGVLRSSVESSPIVLVATHFKELVTARIVDVDSTRLRIGSMEVLTQPTSNGFFAGELVYLYRFTLGTLASESHAIRCASFAGVPENILRRAFQIQEIVSGANSENEVDINLIDPAWAQTFEAEELAFTKFAALDISSCEDLMSFMREI